jgi:uncharacterized protein (TIGR03435 family)
MARTEAHGAAVFVMALAPLIVAAQQFQTAPATPVDPETRFEVVAIKPIDSANTAMTIMMTPSGLESSVPVGVLLRQALQKPDYQMTGAPAWVNTERYSIRAKPSAGTPPAAMSVMIRNLLRDRFRLATHLETREQPVFHLVIARSDGRLGPDLKIAPACPSPPCGSGRTAPGLLVGNGRRMAQLVTALSDLTGRPVVDKTGLSELYDFTLKFTYEGRIPGLMGPLGAPAGTPVPAADPDAPSLSAALQEQLGLKLESARGPVEVAVIERFEKPTFD